MKYSLTLALGLVLILFAGAAPGADDEYKSPQERISYGLGHDLGLRIKQQYGDVVPDVLYKGLQDAFDGEAPKVTQEELAQELAAWRQVQSLKAKAMGETFLAENRKRKAVTATSSGLQYEVLKEGSGKSPVESDSVIVHYRGTMIDGTEFDSSYKRGGPATFPVSGVIAGMTEALLLMKEGAKWKLFIPPGIAYGERGAGGAIGPNETLIFELELVGIQADK
ncbi:MAG: FKBP-type peptidyl-prolyl cis-trans isomerase [Thermodesulfovibrionales bacterium]|nr:FKBP-type peptidyl-prolyl cis-trans isomerase [Thermodesulfovibrionales bacterium]